MNTAIATGRGSGLDEGQFAGIGLAIPLEMIEPVVDQLISGGEVMKGYLGLSVVDREYFLAEDLGAVEFPLRGGLFVATVEPDHPARAAGLRAGDVITRAAGSDVSTVEQFLDVAAAAGPEAPFELTIWRDRAVGDRGHSVSIQVPDLAGRGLRGITLLAFQDSIGQLFTELGFTGHGVRVAQLEGDGPARAAGVRRGDIITHVNERAIGTVQQLRSMISSMLPGQTAHLRVWRYDGDTGAGRELEIPVELARLHRGLALGSADPAPDLDSILRDLGIDVETTTRDDAARSGVPFHRGVMVTAIRAPSPAAEAGLVVKATIVEVSERPVESVEEFLAALRRSDLRRGVRLTVILPGGEVIRPVLTTE